MSELETIENGVINKEEVHTWADEKRALVQQYLHHAKVAS